MALAESELGTTLHRLRPSFPPIVEPLAEFEELYEKYAPYVERVVRRYVKERVRAEDLVQETFLRAYRAWGNIDIDRPLWPWLRTIAQRICIDAWRAELAEVPVVSSDSAPLLMPPSSEPDPAEALISSMLREGIHQTLRTLQPRQRRLLLLRDLHGLRYEEIAQIEGTTVAAIRCSLARARRRFRSKYLARDCGLNTIVWPVFGHVLLPGLRALTRRCERLRGSVLRRANSLVNVDGLVSTTSAQVSGIPLVIAIVLGLLAPPGLQHSRPGDAMAADTHRSSAEEDPQRSGVRSGSTVGSAVLAAARSGVTSEEFSLRAATQVSTGSQDGSSAGSPNDVSAPTIPHDPLPRSDEIEQRAPIKSGDITEPNERVYEPEDARMASFAHSSTENGTIFAAGRNRECATRMACPALLFRSTDEGASWTRLRAEGFDGGALLLPPAYGAGDDRIFAMSSAGVLQVSDDAGSTFRSAAVLGSSFTGAMDISPAFNAGDPRILIGAQTNLFQYRDDTRSIIPAPYSSIPGSLEPAFATPDLLMVGGRMLNEKRMWGSAVFRCDGSACTGTRFSDDARTTKLRLARSFVENGLMYAFTESRLFASQDGGTSFSPLVTPWVGADLVDVALAEDGKRLFAAVSRPQANGMEGLYVSVDAGSTWTRITSTILDGGVTVVRVAGSRVFVGLTYGVACSSDLGATWERRC